jgi:hypothetical protein
MATFKPAPSLSEAGNVAAVRVWNGAAYRGRADPAQGGAEVFAGADVTGSLQRSATGPYGDRPAGSNQA